MGQWQVLPYALAELKGALVAEGHLHEPAPGDGLGVFLVLVVPWR